MPFDSLDAPQSTRRQRLLRLRQIVADENNRIDLNEFRHDRGCCIAGLAYSDDKFLADGLGSPTPTGWSARAAQFFDISLAYGTFTSKQNGTMTHREEALERIDTLLAADANGTLLPFNAAPKDGKVTIREALRELVIAYR